MHRQRQMKYETVTNCSRLKMKAADGKMRLTDVATMEQGLPVYHFTYRCKEKTGLQMRINKMHIPIREHTLSGWQRM